MATLILASQQIRDRAREKFTDRTKSKSCGQCGETFYRDKRSTYKYWERARFCSRKCSGMHKAEADRHLVPDIKTAFWLKVSKGEPDDCWEWIGTKDRDGYPIVSFNRKLFRAARVAVELSGITIPKNHHACHACGNEWCCNPSHIYSGSPKQNNADKRKHGTQQRGEDVYCAKLTEEQIREIRSMYGSHSFIANLFGVSRSNISMIQDRKTWRHVE